MKTTMKRTGRGKSLNGEPNPIDIHVGNRIKLRRTLLGLSQEKLADMLGLTFQQVQKYERGMNRVGASRLWDISKILEIPVSFFYEDMDPKLTHTLPLCPDSEQTLFLAEDSEQFNDDPMQRQETLELVRAYYKIANRKTAKLILEALKEMAKSTPNVGKENKDNNK